MTFDPLTVHILTIYSSHQPPLNMFQNLSRLLVPIRPSVLKHFLTSKLAYIHVLLWSLSLGQYKSSAPLIPRLVS